VAEGLLAGKVAMISGVGAGLGRQTALALARHGASVALAARTTQHIDALADEIGRDRAMAVQGDITDPSFGDAFLAATLNAFGGPRAGPSIPTTSRRSCTPTSTAGGRRSR
jgi:NADP-dependent 3-hydroxy acid dehydrogenase YdfG